MIGPRIGRLLSTRRGQPDDPAPDRAACILAQLFPARVSPSDVTPTAGGAPQPPAVLRFEDQPWRLRVSSGRALPQPEAERFIPVVPAVPSERLTPAGHGVQAGRTGPGSSGPRRRPARTASHPAPMGTRGKKRQWGYSQVSRAWSASSGRWASTRMTTVPRAGQAAIDNDGTVLCLKAGDVDV